MASHVVAPSSDLSGRSAFFCQFFSFPSSCGCQSSEQFCCFFQLLDNPPLLPCAWTPNTLGLSIVKSESLLATFPSGFEVLLFPNHVDR